MALEQSKISSPGRSSVRWQSLLLLTAAVAGGGLALARNTPGETQSRVAAPGPSQPEAAQVPAVVAQVVTAGPLDRSIRVTGSLRSNEVVKVSTKAVGRVERMLVEEGKRVRRGQLLVELDDSELQAQRSRALAAVRAADANVRAAEANRRAAQSRLSQATTSRTVKDAAAEGTFRQAEQELAAARSRLSQTKAQAGIEATQAETRVSAARSALQSARERLKVLQEGARRQETAQAQAAVAQAQAQSEKLKGMLSRREQLLREGAIAAEEVENARRDYEAAAASLAAARENLDLVREGPRSEEVRIGEEAIRQAEATLRDAEANKARRAISNDDVETAAAQVRSAEAALEAARAGLGQRQMSQEEIQAARAALSQADAAIGQARAASSQAQADVRHVEAQIALTRVYSPVDGVVSERRMHVGESVSAANNELMTLVASDTLYLEATAPETALPFLREGAPAAVTLDALPGKTFAGTLREVIRVTEGDTRTVRLRISVARAARAGVVGGFARATLQGGSRAPVITVPRTAVVSDQGQTSVYVYLDGAVQHRPVRLGSQSGGRVQIVEGLRVGEVVVTQDADGLEDGQRVRLASEEATGAAGTPGEI